MATTENYLGSALTGSDGSSNRTLTLSNTRLTLDNGLNIHVDGYFLHPSSDFTIVHNSSASVITFLNAIFNEQKITVEYLLAGPGGDPGQGDSGILPFDTQLLTNEIDYMGETLTLSTISGSSQSTWGDTYDETTSDSIIKAVINVMNPQEELVREGRFQPGDLRVFFKPGQTVLIGDKLYRNVDSKWYQIVEVNHYSPMGTTYATEARAEKI